MRTVVVSGGWDPLHPGHLALFRQARALGDRLVVVVESDEWVARKHRVQQPQRDRANLVADIRGVDAVLLNDRADGNCAHLVRAANASVFAVGQDHADIATIPEYAELTAAGIRIQPVPTAYQDYRSSRIVEGIWENPPVLATALIRSKVSPNKVLVAVRRDNGKLELPGGFVEVGETLEQAIVREVKEELGTEFRVDRYEGSEVGKYRDGRDVLVIGFAGTMSGGFEISSETAAIRWVGGAPDGEWDSEIDRRFVQKCFEGQRLEKGP